MAQFTVHGRLKPLLNGDGMSISGFEPKATSPPGIHKRRFKFHGSSSPKLYASSGRKFSRFEAEALRRVRNEEIHDDDDEDTDELESDELSCFRGLVLDVSYRPVNVVCWKRAICLEFLEKADVLEYYDQTVNSPSGSFYIPAVLRVPQLLQVVKRRRIKNTLSRKNIIFRDSFTCQYCSSPENLTIDHVLPVARGGKWTWENLVTACSKCNSKKGQKTVEEANMKLLKVPKAPKEYDILAIPLTNSSIKMFIVRNGTPEEWRQYLSRPTREP
ncbi:hypothetical protein RHSIM_Rhsim04G0087000 [Rhododendron simsii]|uniref:HNH nuclease domain-containing protein n=1 Tax=Rhododendron simsii TaxID=118357 RepID=A0A834LTP0_RHOSS|nr:hypothetical protein RHSIM_Rhsim04G0087000 [Rhododendron simsii]